MKLRESIIRLREKKGYSQRELAERIGVNVSLIGAFEAGLKVPSLLVADALANELGCTVDELMHGDRTV